MKRTLALLALITLSALQILLAFEVTPGLRLLLLLAMAIAAIAAALTPWRWTLTLTVLWPFTIDPAATLRILAGDWGRLDALHRWAGQMSPYPLFLTLIGVTALVWGWRLWFEGPGEDRLSLSPPLGLAWLWIAIHLGGLMIGLAALNPMGRGATWLNFLSDLWRWPVMASVDRFHPVSQGFAAVVTAGFFLALRSQMRRRGPSAISALQRAMVWSGLLVAALGLIQHLDPSRLVVASPTWVSDRRVTGPLRDPNTCAIFLGAIFVMLLPWMARRWRTWSRGQRLWHGTAAVIIGVAMVLTGSRAIWFAVPIALLLWPMLPAQHLAQARAPMPLHRRIAAGFAAAAALAALLWSAPPPTPDSPRSLLQRRLHDTLAWREPGSDPAMRTGLAGRPHHWRTGWAMIQDRPLLGQGLGTTVLVYERFRTPGSPYERQNLHSQWLQTAAELGVPGLAVLIALFAMGLVNRGAPIGPRLGLAVFALAGITGHPLVVPEMHLLLWLLFALSAPAASRGGAWSRPTRWLALCALALLVGGVAALRITQSRVEPMSGVYEIFQSDGTEVPFLWTRNVATLRLAVEDAHLMLPVRAGHPDVGDRPVEVRVAVNGEGVRTERLSDHGWHLWILDLRPWMGETVTLEIEADRTWTPLRFLGVPDSRDLALALGPWRWLGETLRQPREAGEPWPIPTPRSP